MRIFSHRHENLFSWAREFRLFVTPRGRPTVRSGRGTSSAPPLQHPSIAQDTLSLLLIYRANPGGLAEIGGRRPWTSGVALREQPDNRPRAGPGHASPEAGSLHRTAQRHRGCPARQGGVSIRQERRGKPMRISGLPPKGPGKIPARRTVLAFTNTTPSPRRDGPQGTAGPTVTARVVRLGWKGPQSPAVRRRAELRTCSTEPPCGRRAR